MTTEADLVNEYIDVLVAEVANLNKQRLVLQAQLNIKVKEIEKLKEELEKSLEPHENL